MARAEKRRAASHVALLRGINVGGKNKLPMNDLAAVFTDVGCTSVQTYIQSGNVVFFAKAALAKRVARLVAAAIAERLGLDVPVVLRTVEELRAVAGANPFLKKGTDTKTLHVAFLADRPDAKKVAALEHPDPKSSDAFAVRGREVYLLFPAGVAKTKLSNRFFDARLETTSTVRNWRTVLKLVDLAGGA